MRLDAARSRVAIYTQAEGLFSALAHDLELVAGDLQGEANEPAAEIRVRVASIKVGGVMKRGGSTRPCCRWAIGRRDRARADTRGGAPRAAR